MLKWSRSTLTKLLGYTTVRMKIIAPGSMIINHAETHTRTGERNTDTYCTRQDHVSELVI
jgi:hypothetical protein